MFAYCGNNSVNFEDSSGHMMIGVLQSYEGCFSDGGGSGSCSSFRTYLYSGTRHEIPTSFSLLEESKKTTTRTQVAKLISGGFSGYSLGDSGLNLVSFDLSVISLDMTTATAEWSLFDLGNANVSAGIKGLPYASAMVSLWSPSVSFSLLNKNVTLSLHVGAIGFEANFNPADFSVGYAKGIGFSFAIS